MPAEASSGSGKLLHGASEVIKLLELIAFDLDDKCLKPEVKSSKQLRPTSLLLAAVGMLSCLALTFERESVCSDPADNDKERGYAGSNNGGLWARYVEQRDTTEHYDA